MNRVVVAMLPMLLACAGCSVILKPGESQCETTKDCEARGFEGAVCKDGLCTTQCQVDKDCADQGLTGQVCKNKVCEEPPPDPVWGCLGNVPNPTPDPTKKVDFNVPLLNAADNTPANQVTVDLCAKLDLNCTGVSPDYPKGLTPGADGVIHLSVVQGWDGFVRITGMGFMEGRVFPGRPIVTAPYLKEVRLLKPSDYALIAAFASQDVDMTRGTAILYAVDCGGKPAAGVRFAVPSADAKSLEFYLVNMAPTAYPDAMATDVDGFGGFFNLPPGPAVVQGTRVSDETYIGQSGFQVLANTISYVMISPTPK